MGGGESTQQINLGRQHEDEDRERKSLDDEARRERERERVREEREQREHERRCKERLLEIEKRERRYGKEVERKRRMQEIYEKALYDRKDALKIERELELKKMRLINERDNVVRFVMETPRTLDNGVKVGTFKMKYRGPMKNVKEALEKWNCLVENERKHSEANLSPPPSFFQKSDPHILSHDEY